MLTWLVNTRLADHILATVEQITGTVLISANEPDLRPELTRADNTIRELHRQLRAAERRLHDAEHAADITAQLFTTRDRGVRIRTAHTLWPQLTQRALAAVTDSSVSYVNNVLNAEEKHDGKD